MDEQPTAPTQNVTPPPAGPLPVPPVPPAPMPPTPPAPAPPAAPAAPASLPNVPDSWPGAFGAYKFSKQAVKVNVGTIIALWVVSFIIQIVVELALKSVGDFIAYLIGSLFAAALTLVYINGVRGQRLSFGQALSGGLSLWLKMIGLEILVGFSALISVLFLIIPFFFVFPRLLLSSYFLVDRRMGVVEAYKAGWTASKGNVGKIWGVVGATILMGLLSVTIIGIPFSIYFLIMYSGAIAILYEYLNKSQPAMAAAGATPVAPPPANPPIAPAGPPGAAPGPLPPTPPAPPPAA